MSLPSVNIWRTSSNSSSSPMPKTTSSASLRIPTSTYNYTFTTLIAWLAPLTTKIPPLTLMPISLPAKKLDQLWQAKLKKQNLIRSAKRNGRLFIRSIIKDMWLIAIKSSTTFYNQVTLCFKIFDSRLESTNAVTLHSAIIGWWAEEPHAPKYINCLEERHKNSERSNFKINYACLADITSSSLI